MGGAFSAHFGHFPWVAHFFCALWPFSRGGGGAFSAHFSHFPRGGAFSAHFDRSPGVALFPHTLTVSPGVALFLHVFIFKLIILGIGYTLIYIYIFFLYTLFLKEPDKFC